jgi:hypothetical protein
MNKPKSHQSIIIYDWDDTLMPTSYVNPSGMLDKEELPPLMKKTLLSIGDLVVIHHSKSIV